MNQGSGFRRKLAIQPDALSDRLPDAGGRADRRQPDGRARPGRRPARRAAATPSPASSTASRSTINDNLSRFSDVQTLQTAHRRPGNGAGALPVGTGRTARDQQRLPAPRRPAQVHHRRCSNQEFVTANVIGVDESGFLRTITVDHGTRDGVAVGMPVVTGQGLVGRVIRVSANAARVMLVTEPSSAVSARLQTTRVEGTVRGQPAGTLQMDMIPLDSQVQRRRPGDHVRAGRQLPARHRDRSGDERPARARPD